MHRISKTIGAIVAGALALSLVACSSNTGPAATEPDRLSQEEIDEALQTDTTLVFWTWVSGIEEEVAQFTQKYPAIKVKVENAGQGAPQYTKLRTALTAGSGAPDLAQIGYDYISTFAITDSLVDIRPYVSEDFDSKFVDWTIEQVGGADGQLWAVPQDTGPMGLLYRSDILEQYGIDVPTTWEEFAEAARELHAANTEVYLTNFPPNVDGFWTALNWQAGNPSYTVADQETLSFDVNSEEAKRIADFWQGLVDEGVISTDPEYTDEWYQGLNSGRYASWPTAAWGPLFLESSAPATAGLWRAAEFPVWEGSEAVSANRGGSTTAVISGTKNAIAAAALAEFLNSDPDVSMALATERSLFPAAVSTLEDPEFLDASSDFYGGQKVNALFAEISETVNPNFDFPPFRDMDITIWKETVGTAIDGGGDIAASLDEWQDRLVAYAEEQGFTVK
ncbi:extracellular solute-binding protein [Microbacterium sp. ARD31]|uniref:ABC transporter substrate-binding protein n=1 Tax=Microbacterium sp. ARD31 TaxID=2962576 RepID=UPI002881E65C|nr:extracellular solute-binding protein [Microbacterium sp. ARD31]MDT0186072.1 extracellular solute-binding protein [Microbacterium sp. ARD31]